MKHLFSLTAEGGPLLCWDARAASSWRGGGDGATDYDELCAQLESRSISSAVILSVRGSPCVVWEMEGAGVADVFAAADGSLVVLRAWVSGDDEDDAEIGQLAVAAPTRRRDLGELEVPSGVLAVLWAPESGEGVPEKVDDLWRPVAGMSIEASGFVVKAPRRRYRCSDERVEVGESEGRLLRLTPV